MRTAHAASRVIGRPLYTREPTRLVVGAIARRHGRPRLELDVGVDAAFVPVEARHLVRLLVHSQQVLADPYFDVVLLAAVGEVGNGRREHHPEHLRGIIGGLDVHETRQQGNFFDLFVLYKQHCLSGKGETGGPLKVQVNDGSPSGHNLGPRRPKAGVNPDVKGLKAAEGWLLLARSLDKVVAAFETMA